MNQLRGKIAELAAKKQAEEQADLTALQDGALYIMLLVREGKPNNFHWALYHHHTHTTGGHKFHIVGTPGRSESWFPDHEITRSAMSSIRLLGLVRIAENLGSRVAEVRDAITARDDALATIPALTCRVYIKLACERLRKDHLIDFPDWTGLEKDIMAFGNSQSAIVLDACAKQEHVKPRPVRLSNELT